jgi:type IV pilus assembly protein PilF
MRRGGVASKWLGSLAVIVLLAGCQTSDSFRKSPKDAAEYNTRLGIEYMRQGHLAEAKQKLERAVEQNPQSALAQASSGLLYDRLGEPKQADRHFARAVALEPDNADILNNYAVFLCRNDEPERGQKYFLEAANNPLYRTPEVAFLNAGTCARDGGDLESAEQHFRRALAVKPQFQDALLALAELQLGAGRSLPARAFLERYFAAGGQSAQALWLGVQVEHALGNAAGADDYAERLKDQYPTSRQTRDLLKQERSGS